MTCNLGDGGWDSGGNKHGDGAVELRQRHNLNQQQDSTRTQTQQCETETKLQG